MCEVNTQVTPHKGCGVDIGVTCSKTGKPITVSNKYGMFCEDLCDLQESKDALLKLKAMFPGVF